TRFSRDWSSDVCSSDLTYKRTHRKNTVVALGAELKFRQKVAQRQKKEPQTQQLACQRQCVVGKSHENDVQQRRHVRVLRKHLSVDRKSVVQGKRVDRGQ